MISEIRYEPIDANEALELACRQILFEENNVIVGVAQDITLNKLSYIANRGLDFFVEMLSGSYAPEEVDRYRHINTTEELAAAYAEQKEVHFGKGKQSCALHLFQHLLTK